MGGTFDPIHYGHLVAAEGARYQFRLDKVVFIPAGRPPHKTAQEISPARHRIMMTLLALQSNPHFTFSSVEVERPGPSYTVDTVHEMRRCFPGAELYFITGADAVLGILSWYRVEELLSLCDFVAATRPGYRLENLQQCLGGLPGHLLQRIYTMEVPAQDIPSTATRRRVREGRPIKYLLPEAVERYIYRAGLYRDGAVPAEPLLAATACRAADGREEETL